jgi:type I restriction enzyme, S subunit
MSSLNFLEKLLNGFDVEWKKLCDILIIKNGKGYKSFQDGDIPVYGSGGIMTFVDTAVYNKPSVLIPRKGSLGNLYYVDVPFWTVDTIFWTDINTYITVPKFVYYYLQTQHLEDLNMAGGVPSLTQKVLNKIPIPIPCPNNPEKSLEIQSEIVRILDTFTEHTAELITELTTELTARKKQYSYYRDQLLSFEEGQVEWKALGDISTKISSGGTPKTGIAKYYDGDIPWLRTQEVNFGEIWDTGVKITESGLSKSSAKWIPKNCVIIAMYGATVGKIAINKIPMTTNQACANIQLDNSLVNYRYVFHFLSSQYEYIKSLGTGSQTNINAGIVKRLQIPIPFANNPEKSLAEQARIVSILDKFDTLTHSISEGLPREIELRQKQYEYYRDLLLSFPKPETV